jgi:hypothetical protein
MITSLHYSLTLFIIISVMISAIYREEIKNNNKKHLVSAMYMLLAIFVHAVVIVVRETLF